MARRTKIIASIGPACDTKETLKPVIEAGADVIRLSLAHGTIDQQIEKYHLIRSVSADLDKHVGILVDLPGPKIRCAEFVEKGCNIFEKDQILVTPDGNISTAERIVVEYEPLLRDVNVGDRLAFGDGGVVLAVIDQTKDALVAEVVHGGHLEGRPGVHIPSDQLDMPTPTEQDLKLAEIFTELGTDMLAVSFVRSADDMRRLGAEPAPRGPLLVAKIETRSAVANLEGIIEASGAVMVARGDLGAEFDIEDLPHLQKRIIEACIALGRPAITATQMLESLLSASIPTRAEASDVANAVFDGTSAVMLSGETAIGHDPVNAVATMARIAARADEHFNYTAWVERISSVRRGTKKTEEYLRVTDALTMAAARAATAIEADAIMCLSRSGFTARSMARFRPSIPMVGFTPDPRTAHQLSLSWGVKPFIFEENWSPTENATKAVDAAAAAGLVRSGDMVVVVSGSSSESHATDSMRVVRVP